MTAPNAVATTQKAVPAPKASALGIMAARLNVDPSKLLDTLKATVFRGANNDELLALVVIANEYELNPILREMFAFPGKKGGIVPLVSIDGWCRIINRQPHFDGVEFAFTTNEETGKPESCTCSIFVKDRSRPVTVTEYYSECYRNTDPWNQMPFRQLRHKALIQCGRYAFGFSGIHDEDEARDQAATNFQIPDTKTLTAVTVTTPEPEPTSEGEGDFAPETTAQQSQTPADKPKPSEPREPQLALANLIIEAGHKFDDFKKWGQEMFPNMPWDNINSFDEVPTQDAKRFQRAHVGLLRALAAVKGGAAL